MVLGAFQRDVRCGDWCSPEPIGLLQAAQALLQSICRPDAMAMQAEEGGCWMCYPCMLRLDSFLDRSACILARATLTCGPVFAMHMDLGVVQSGRRVSRY
jgi:hypothetical protein